MFCGLPFVLLVLSLFLNIFIVFDVINESVFLISFFGLFIVSYVEIQIILCIGLTYIS